MLTEEQKKQLEELKRLEAETNKPKDLDLNDLSDAEVRKMAADLLDGKRSANDEAKTLRLKLEKIEKERADAKKKVDDENLTAQQQLTAIQAENTTLIAKNESIKLQSQARSELVAKGFKPELVDNAVQLSGLNADNYSDNIGNFETVFKDFKVDPKAPTTPAMNRRPTNNPPPVKPDDKKSLTTRVAEEMYSGGGGKD